MNNTFPIHLALGLVALLYAGNYTIAKEVMPEYMAPSALILLRALVAVPAFWLLSSDRSTIKGRDYLRLLACGFLGVAANQLLFFEGLSLTRPINASLIMTTTPILVFVASAIILRERITGRKILGIVLGFTGAALLLVNDSFKIGEGTWFGDLLVFLNATSYGLYLVLVKPLLKKYSPLTVIKWVFLFGLLFIIPFGAPPFLDVEWSQLPSVTWLYIAYIALGVTVLAYLLNIWALSKADASLVGIYIYLQPLLATVIAVIAAKDVLTLPKVLFSLLIFAGVYLVSRK